MRPARVDYDVVAHLYDTTPHRTKPIDPDLLSFIGQRATTADITVLDRLRDREPIDREPSYPDRRPDGRTGSLVGNAVSGKTQRTRHSLGTS